MKQSEFRHCCLCGKGVAHGGDVYFYRFKVEQHLLDGGAIRRAHGLEQFFGGGNQGAVLASVMGANEDLSQPVWRADVVVCGPCSLRALVGSLVAAAGEAGAVVGDDG